MRARRGPLSERVSRLALPIHGRRVDLVAPSVQVVPATVRLMNDPSIYRGTLHVPHPYTARHAREWVRKAAANLRAGQNVRLVIVRRSDGELLGGVGLHQFLEESARAEVGYWLGRQYRGQGYATEAVNLIVQVGFERLRLHRIEARIFPWNSSSRRLALRCGFRYEGRLRDEVCKEGRWLPTLLFARLASDRVGHRGR